MKSLTLLVILATCGLIEANKSEQIFENMDPKGKILALIFTIQDTRFYLVPTKKYIQEKIDKRNEVVAFTCPASQDEIRTKILENEEKSRAAAASKKKETRENSGTPPTSLSGPILLTSSPVEGPKLRTSASAREPMQRTSSSVTEPELQTKSDLVEDLSESSAEDDSKIALDSKTPLELKIPSTSDNDTEKNYDYNDYVIYMSEILHELASRVYQADDFYSPNVNYCEENFRPQRAIVGECRRLIAGVENPGRLYSISYEMVAKKNDKDYYANLYVYAKCLNLDIQETLYVMYKIIPPTSLEEPQPIDYDNFDPAKNCHEDVVKPYFMNEQKTLLKKLDGKIKDDVIPQRLIPVYSIAEDYSRGTVAEDNDIFRPQWRSKAKIWDALARVIFNHGKMLKWIIYTGTVGTLLSAKNKPMVIQSSKDQNSKLSIPLYWWTLIMKTDSRIGEGIVIVMLNQPNTPGVEPLKNFENLCTVKRICLEIGWGEIINDENSGCVMCCEVNIATTRPLIGKEMDLNILSLENEKKKEIVQDRVKVSSLLWERRNISNVYSDWKKAEEKIYKDAPQSANSSDLNTKAEVPPGTASPYATPMSSPGHDDEIESPRSVLPGPEFTDDVKGLGSESKSNRRYFPFKLPTIGVGRLLSRNS